MKPSIRVYNSLNQRTTGTDQARLCVTETDRSADLPAYNRHRPGSALYHRD
ncbi:hypothetical protein J6590_026432 [Homalodisca vitripennis]|nr:hypothetical protein J6590_026432 [Homalodisca vitripennis]